MFLSLFRVAFVRGFVSLICRASGVSRPFGFFYKQSRCALFAYGCVRALILTKVHALGSPVARYVVSVVGQLVARVKGRVRLVKLAAKNKKIKEQIAMSHSKQIDSIRSGLVGDSSVTSSDPCASASTLLCNPDTDDSARSMFST